VAEVAAARGDMEAALGREAAPAGQAAVEAAIRAAVARSSGALEVPAATTGRIRRELRTLQRLPGATRCPCRMLRRSKTRWLDFANGTHYIFMCRRERNRLTCNRYKSIFPEMQDCAIRMRRFVLGVFTCRAAPEANARARLSLPAARRQQVRVSTQHLLLRLRLKTIRCQNGTALP
jgi:hypothetical protein